MKSERLNIEGLNKENVIYLIERDKNSFLVYDDNGCINSYDSFTCKETKIGSIKINWSRIFKKMFKVTENDILFVYQELIAFLNIISKSFNKEDTIYEDICYAPNSNNSFLATYIKNSNNVNGIDVISYNPLNKKMIISYSQNNLS